VTQSTFSRGALEREIDNLIEYQAFIEEQLERAASADFNETRKWLSESHEYGEQTDADVEYYDEHYQYLSPYVTVFPRCLWYSFVVLVYLVFESEVGRLCDEINRRRDIRVRLNDLKGDLLSRCKTYLEKLGGLNVVSADLWEKLEDLSKIRNCIVHTAGRYERSNDKKRLQYLAGRVDGLTVDEDDIPEESLLMIGPEYCKAVVQDVRRFFQVVLDGAGISP